MTALEQAVLLLSLQVAGIATLLALPLGIAVALLLARRPFPGQQLLNLMVHLPLVLPPVATGYLLLLAFGAQGPLGRWLAEHGVQLAFHGSGAVLAAAVMGFPLLVRALRLSAGAIDPGLAEAASTLGAGRLRIFCTITLPLLLPGLLAGAMLAFAKAMGEFGATITFAANIPGETQTLSLALHQLLQQPGGEAGAWRLMLVAVVVSTVALALSEWLSRRTSHR